MNFKLTRGFTWSTRHALVGVAAALAGCGQSVQLTSIGGKLYPEPPAVARVQFLTSLTGAADARDDGGSSLGKLLFGAPSEPLTRVSKPYGMAVHDGRLYVCDVAEGDVFIFDFAAGRCTAWNHPNVRFGKPVAIRFRHDGNAEVCDVGLGKVFLLSPGGQLISIVGLDTLQSAGSTSGLPERFKPVASAAGPDGASAVLNAAAHRIELIDMASGRHLGAWSGPGSEAGRLFAPTAMTDTAGGIVVSDVMNRRLVRFDRGGSPAGVIGEPGDAPGYIAHPKGVATDAAGALYVADSALQIVGMFDSGGDFLMSFGGPEEADGGLLSPAGVCLDRSCLPHFKKHIAPGFDAEYLIFVSNQMGPSRISVYAFGQGQAGAAPAG